jgi:hypothetical protein
VGESAVSALRWADCRLPGDGQRPAVHALQRYEFIVLFPVNPATLAKYREAFVPSRAKDNPSDAEIALELVVRHRDKLQALNRKVRQCEP